MTLITDPITTQLDPVTNDLPDGPLTESRGFEALVQGCRVRLSICAGEDFANLDQGVRYRARAGVPAELALLGHKFNQTKTINEFRANLLGDNARAIDPVPGLVSLPVLAATFDHDTRIMSVLFKATAAFGDTPVDTLAVKV